jgi:hypothetical protein
MRMSWTRKPQGGGGSRWRKKAAPLACLLAFLAHPALAMARPSIWFSADEPWVRAWKKRPANDYMNLFSGDGAWAKDVDVIQLSMQFVQLGDENEIKAVIAFARSHKLKIAMVGLMLAKGPNNCGDRLEGYSGPHGVEKAAMRFKQLGGVLDYLTMDEPVYYGSTYPLGNACQTPLPALAAEIAERVRMVRAVFPSIEIGEDEVAGLADKFHWVQTVAAWLDAYRKAVGEPLAYLRLDIGWPSPRWPGHVKAIAAIARRDGVKFAYYDTGVPTDPDDATWSSHARAHAWMIERDLGVRPDQVAIASWMPRPTRMLPPSDPSTLTGLLRCYALMQQNASAFQRVCP